MELLTSLHQMYSCICTVPADWRLVVSAFANTRFPGEELHARATTFVNECLAFGNKITLQLLCQVLSSLATLQIGVIYEIFKNVKVKSCKKDIVLASFLVCAV